MATAACAEPWAHGRAGDRACPGRAAAPASSRCRPVRGRPPATAQTRAAPPQPWCASSRARSLPGQRRWPNPKAREKSWNWGSLTEPSAASQRAASKRPGSSPGTPWATASGGRAAARPQRHHDVAWPEAFAADVTALARLEQQKRRRPVHALHLEEEAAQRGRGRRAARSGLPPSREGGVAPRQRPCAAARRRGRRRHSIRAAECPVVSLERSQREGSGLPRTASVLSATAPALARGIDETVKQRGLHSSVARALVSPRTPATRSPVKRRRPV